MASGPAYGAAGTVVWIFGANLDAFASVQFGGVEVMSVWGGATTW